MTEENNTEIAIVPNAVGLSSSILKKTRPEKLRRITRQTDPETTLGAFQNQDMTPEKFGGLADQVLTRRVQKAAQDILASGNAEVEDTPPGFSDGSGQEDGPIAVRRRGRANKNQGPKRYVHPVTHSIKLICSEEDIKDLKKAALEAYRIRLANFKTKTEEPVGTRLGLLERHLSRRKFGCASLDITKTCSVEVPLQLKTNEDESEPRKPI